MDAQADQLAQDVQEWTAIARARFSASRDARKLAEYQAQLLANRIALLKDEEAKAWKKIDQMRKRTKEVVETRERTEKRCKEKEELRRARELEEAALRKRNAESRSRASLAKQEKAKALEDARKASAGAIRSRWRDPDSTEGCLIRPEQRAQPQPRAVSASAEEREPDSLMLRARSEEPRIRAIPRELEDLEREERALHHRLLLAAAAGVEWQSQYAALEDGLAGKGGTRPQHAALEGLAGTRASATPPSPNSLLHAARSASTCSLGLGSQSARPSSRGRLGMHAPHPLGPANSCYGTSTARPTRRPPSGKPGARTRSLPREASSAATVSRMASASALAR